MFLTNKAIKNAKPQSKPYKIFDGEGLYLLIEPTGSKLWRLKYHFGKEKLLAIGSYPGISLSEARDYRYEAKKLLRANIDPSTRKQEARRAALFDAENTFRAVAKDWFDTNRNGKKWSVETADRIWRRLELHVMPALQNMPIALIKTPDLVILIRKVGNVGKLEMASRIIGFLCDIFRHAIRCGVLNYNPAVDLKGVVPAPKVTHYPAIRPSELPELLSKLEAVNTTPLNKMAMRLLLHVFLRTGELRFGIWQEIDWHNKLWIVPPQRMKIKEREEPHLIPLSEQTLLLLRELKALTGHSKYLFPSQQRRKHPVMSENTINKILHNMGYKGTQVGHGFRSIASTALNESGKFRSDAIEFQLTHIEQDSSRKPYNRAEYLEERRCMMQWWSDYIEAASNRAATL